MQEDYSFWVIPLYKDNDKLTVLIVQHLAWHRGFPKWHQNVLETAMDTAKRELKEETWLEVIKFIENEKYDSVYFFKSWSDLIKKTVSYFIWFVNSKNVSIDKKEILDYKFLSLEELVNLDLPKWNIKFFEEVKEYIEKLVLV